LEGWEKLYIPTYLRYYFHEFVLVSPFSPTLNIPPWVINIIPTYYDYLESFFVIWVAGKSATTIGKVFFFASFR
jgi:hypothetical protein